MKRLIWLIIIIVAFFLNGIAYSAPTTIQYSGTVDYINMLPNTYFDSGDSVLIEYTFESTTPDSNPGDPTIGNYMNPMSNLSITFGSYVASAASIPYFQVGDNYSGIYDYFSLLSLSTSWSSDPLQSLTGPAIGDWEPIQFVLQFVDPSMVALSSDSLPLGVLDASNFISPNTYISLTFHNSLTGANSAVVATFDTSSVPVPSALLLLSSGLLGLVGVSRRKK